MSLKLNNVTKKFGQKTILENFSYNFPDSGIFAITGESGVGKTTLLRIIAGIDKDYAGTVIGGGIGQVSFAFQEYRLFPTLSASDNIIFAVFEGKGAAESEATTKLLLKLGFDNEDLNLMPDQLSGGMKQRVSLARAILFDKPILILDEPTKELDANNAKIVLDIISEIANSKLVILVSHNKEDVQALGATIIPLE